MPKTLMLTALAAGAALFAHNPPNKAAPFERRARQAQNAKPKAANAKPDRMPGGQKAGWTKPRFRIAYKLSGFGAAHEEKMKEALRLLERAVQSKTFKDLVINHTYKGQKSFYRNRGMSNLEIYQAVLKGAESLNPIEDRAMNLDLTLYHSKTNTVGYTYPDTNKIWVNKKYFERYSLGEVANNAMHEWLHKIGFEHSYYKNEDRPHTVPYAIGEIIEKILTETGGRAIF